MRKKLSLLLLAMLILACSEKEDQLTEDTFTGDSGTFIDSRDNHEYKWVRLGDQIWMAENLAYLPRVNQHISLLRIYTKAAGCWTAPTPNPRGGGNSVLINTGFSIRNDKMARDYAGKKDLVNMEMIVLKQIITDPPGPAGRATLPNFREGRVVEQQIIFKTKLQ
jgi:hypothetical protein